MFWSVLQTLLGLLHVGIIAEFKTNMAGPCSSALPSGLCDAFISSMYTRSQNSFNKEVK